MKNVLEKDEPVTSAAENNPVTPACFSAVAVVVEVETWTFVTSIIF